MSDRKRTTSANDIAATLRSQVENWGIPGLGPAKGTLLAAADEIERLRRSSEAAMDVVWEEGWTDEKEPLARIAAALGGRRE